MLEDLTTNDSSEEQLVAPDADEATPLTDFHKYLNIVQMAGMIEPDCPSVSLHTRECLIDDQKYHDAHQALQLIEKLSSWLDYHDPTLLDQFKETLDGLIVLNQRYGMIIDVVVRQPLLTRSLLHFPYDHVKGEARQRCLDRIGALWTQEDYRKLVVDEETLNLKRPRLYRKVTFYSRLKSECLYRDAEVQEWIKANLFVASLDGIRPKKVQLQEVVE